MGHGPKGLVLVPLTLAQANDVVYRLHRHRDPVLSHRLSIGAILDGRLVGCAIVGRRVGRGTEPYLVAEVARCATDGTQNACSLLYAACARSCRAQGYERIQTFTLATEPGTSLHAAGWTREGTRRRDGSGWESRNGRRTTGDEEIPRIRWSKELNPPRNLPAGTLKSDKELAEIRAAERGQGQRTLFPVNAEQETQ